MALRYLSLNSYLFYYVRNSIKDKGEHRQRKHNNHLFPSLAAETDLLFYWLDAAQQTTHRLRSLKCPIQYINVHTVLYS